jgi:hypothetical protein
MRSHVAGHPLQGVSGPGGRREIAGAEGPSQLGRALRGVRLEEVAHLLHKARSADSGQLAKRIEGEISVGHGPWRKESS